MSQCKSCGTEWNYTSNACPSCGSTNWTEVAPEQKTLDPTLKAWYQKIKKHIIPKEPEYPWEAK